MKYQEETIQHQGNVDERNMAAQPENVEGYQQQEMYSESPIPEGEFTEIHSVLVDGCNRFGVSATIFDGQEELLWVGNSGVSMFS